VQSVAASGERTAVAMAQVVATTERSGTMGQSVLTAANDISAVAGTLLAEVGQFMKTMTADASQLARQSDRVSANGAAATLHVPGAAPIPVAIQDISRNGAALRST